MLDGQHFIKLSRKTFEILKNFKKVALIKKMFLTVLAKGSFPSSCSNDDNKPKKGNPEWFRNSW